MLGKPGTPEPSSLGHYRILRRLGEGGMGIVYAAEDERLGRHVAVKKLHPLGNDPKGRERLWREARAAARVNHPSVCQIFEIGEESGDPYIVMELLEGESLAARLSRGALPLDEAASIALQVLTALEALHRAGFVHRDLKPTNVFLTEHGVKLLDFGLARRSAPAQEAQSPHSLDLTEAGEVVGTPRYMAPEQARGRSVDRRTDVFAAGAIVFEMLSGKPAFGGDSPIEAMHAVLHDQPPALGGSPIIVAIDRVVRRAMAKAPEDRYASASDMAQALRESLAIEESATATVAAAVTMTRLIVMPFRLLRPDSEIDFLSFSLPDAISSSLTGLSTLVVRSNLAAARYAGAALDPRAIATELDVDTVMTGTILRAGDRLRVAAQLIEAPGGALLWSETSDVAFEDIFALQDGIARRIVESLALPLSARERRLLSRDVPGTARSYEFYLRANQLAHDSASWSVARDLYRECLRDDPDYAPAWARLGRVLRLLAKYYPEGSDAHLEEAEKAFRRALELNPDLSVAHNLYAQFEVEAGRTIVALRRLLTRAASGSADPEPWVGLVHVLRYCGLLESSLAAHRSVLRLDPAARTSVGYTLFFLGEYEKAIALDTESIPFVRYYALSALGRREEAVAGYREMEGRVKGIFGEVMASQRTAIEGDRAAAVRALEEILPSGFRDPEGLFFVARTYAFVGEHERALALLDRVVNTGFFCVPGFLRDPWLDPLRSSSDFRTIVRKAEELRSDAQAVYEELKGERLLGSAR